MFVIPKQKTYRALKIECSIQFYTELGKYLNSERFCIEKNDRMYRDELYFKTISGEKIKAIDGDYILIDLNDDMQFIYAEKEAFNDDYIKIKEEK